MLSSPDGLRQEAEHKMNSLDLSYAGTHQSY